MNPFFKAIVLIAVMSAAITFTACEQAHTCTYNESTSTLSCPEKAYKTVTLAGKVWMAENMDVYIPDSSICYGNSHSNCETMGRLYTWNAATNGLCPNGWELPSQQAFKDAFGNASAADLKKEGGFNMQFAGFRYFDGKFADKDSSASFWTSDSYDDARAYLVRATDTAITYEHFNKSIAASVRCIKK